MSAFHFATPTQPNPKSKSELLRATFSGQCRLLANRADRGLSIGDGSLENLLRIYRDLVVEQLVETA